jgi:hypothetical protein
MRIADRCLARDAGPEATARGQPDGSDEPQGARPAWRPASIPWEVEQPRCRAEETCDGVDRDCDGVVDEGLLRAVADPTALGVAYGRFPMIPHKRGFLWLRVLGDGALRLERLGPGGARGATLLARDAPTDSEDWPLPLGLTPVPPREPTHVIATWVEGDLRAVRVPLDGSPPGRIARLGPFSFERPAIPSLHVVGERLLLVWRFRSPERLDRLVAEWVDPRTFEPTGLPGVLLQPRFAVKSGRVALTRDGPAFWLALAEAAERGASAGCSLWRLQVQPVLSLGPQRLVVWAPGGSSAMHCEVITASRTEQDGPRPGAVVVQAGPPIEPRVHLVPVSLGTDVQRGGPAVSLPGVRHVVGIDPNAPGALLTRTDAGLLQYHGWTHPSDGGPYGVALARELSALARGWIHRGAGGTAQAVYARPRPSLPGSEVLLQRLGCVD